METLFALAKATSLKQMMSEALNLIGGIGSWIVEITAEASYPNCVACRDFISMTVKEQGIVLQFLLKESRLKMKPASFVIDIQKPDVEFTQEKCIHATEKEFTNKETRMPKESVARGTRITRIVLFAVAVITLILTASFIWSYALALTVGTLTGFPIRFSVPCYFRLGGLFLAGIGAGFATWTFRYRNPKDVIVSTGITFLKRVRRVRIEKPSGRTEPFVPLGPYAYVRNPMYFGVVTILLGVGLATGSTTLLLWSLSMAILFWFVIIPYEEKELSALYGDAYRDYQRRVPKMLPNGREYRSRRAD